MYISCIFHVVSASFPALVTRKFAYAKADSSGIQALQIKEMMMEGHCHHSQDFAD